MARILLCPDSFKGCLSAEEVCASLKDGILKINPQMDVLSLPLADGGEGTLRYFSKALHKKTEILTVKNAYGAPRQAEYLYFEDEKTALIESAQACGIEGLDKSCLNTKQSSTYGVGELIFDAVLNKGAKQIVLTLGGTATTDGGMGALSALGVEFVDKNYLQIGPTGEDMGKVAHIKLPETFETFKSIKFYFAADVKSPFCGKDGAAFVFAPQKGASKEDVLLLDRGLENLAAVYEKTFGREIVNVAGAGAAGGLLGGIYAAFGGERLDCFSLLSKIYRLEEKMQGAALVITGEGKTDSQTALGKLPLRIASLSKTHNVPCVLVSGSVEQDFDAEAFGFRKAISLKTPERNLEDCIKHAPELLALAAEYLLKSEEFSWKKI